MQLEADKPKPAIIVIFGITGDLAQRKLLPALYQLFKADLLDSRTVILGITRRSVTAQELLDNADLCVDDPDKICDPVALKKFESALRMHRMTQTDPREYQELLNILNAIEEKNGVCMDRLYYLSIPPQLFEPIVRNLGEQQLNTSCQHGNAATRLLIEKPFGYDLQSARDLIAETGIWFTEDQLFRIDHYLAKYTVQNIVKLRASSNAVEKVWNNDYIESITITAYEKIDIENRSTFYEEVGALRDFIQSHLMQVLAVTTMDLPDSHDNKAVHTARLTVLEAIQQMSEQDVATHTVRAQYQGYRDEVGIPDSTTETFARIRLNIASKRWEGVPVTLQTGKAMADRRADVRLTFRDTAAELVCHIQPNNGILLESLDDSSELSHVLQPAIDAFNLEHPPGAVIHPDAYETVLRSAVLGDHELFTTTEEILAAWEIVDTVLRVWSRTDQGLVFYTKGSNSIT